MLATIVSYQHLAWPVGGALVAGLLGHLLVYPILKAATARTKTQIDGSFVRHCYAPGQWIVILIGLRMALNLPRYQAEPAAEFVLRLIGLGLIVMVSWLAVRLVRVLEDYLSGRYDVGVSDNLQARKIHTQFRVLKRITVAVVVVLALGTALMMFERVRQLGTTVLASAGVIGLVVGMAAQRVIGNFIAGVQVAITQPIRIDDVVIVEGEWGRIEEITLTYVVVKIWDLRRLIVPINYFIEKPFQNWTRVSAEILGTVFIHLDYAVPVAAVRRKLDEILQGHELWDRKVCVVQVTGATERSVELRALVSAADASKAWTLRCDVREKLIEFVRNEYPAALPRLRIDIADPGRLPETVLSH